MKDIDELHAGYVEMKDAWILSRDEWRSIDLPSEI